MSPLAGATVELVITNRGNEPLLVPKRSLSTMWGGILFDVLYEGRVRVPPREPPEELSGPADSEPLAPLEARRLTLDLRWLIGSRMPGEYRLRVGFRLRSADRLMQPEAWVEQDLSVRVLGATEEDLLGVLSALGQQRPLAKVDRDAILEWGDLGDKRLLAELESLGRRIEEARSKGPDNYGRLRDEVQWATERAQVLVAQQSGDKAAVEAYLESGARGDRSRRVFQAMIRARLLAREGK